MKGQNESKKNRENGIKKKIQYNKSEKYKRNWTKTEKKESLRKEKVAV